MSTTIVSTTPPTISVDQVTSAFSQYLDFISATIYLSGNEVNFIKNLVLQNDEILQKITNVINDIIQDDILQIHEIPQLVLVVSGLIKTHISKKSLANVDIINILKFFFTTLLNSNLLPISPDQTTTAQTVLDTSFTLLETVFEKKNKRISLCSLS